MLLTIHIPLHCNNGSPLSDGRAEPKMDGKLCNAIFLFTMSVCLNSEPIRFNLKTIVYLISILVKFNTLI